MTFVNNAPDASGDRSSPVDAVQDLIVIGAGGTAGEIVWLVQALNQVTPSWRLVGFLDDDRAKQGTEMAGVPVIGSVGAAADHPTARFVVGVAHYRRPRTRLAIAERLVLPNHRYATLIHPAAIVTPGARLGHGTLVFAFAFVGDGARVGNHVLISSHCRISHDTVVGDGATFAAGAVISGGARVGAGSYVGAGGIVGDGVVIGAGAVVGIGSVVVRDVEPDVTVIGNPARVVPGSRSGTHG
jgi:sugar O-acyltransferase (sialic acid O-acetyltransferase NeuD family)